MQLFSAVATMFLRKFKKKDFAHKKLKNHPQKLLRKTLIHFFFLTASTAQMAQTGPIDQLYIELGLKPVTWYDWTYELPRWSLDSIDQKLQVPTNSKIGPPGL